MKRDPVSKAFVPRVARAATLFCAATLLGAATASAMPSEVLFPGAAGAVRFDHDGHARRFECSACHHPASEPGACRACHGSQAAAPRSRDALHKVCTACHLAQGLQARCRDCHAPPGGGSH